jgi:type IV pilus assembly protein PilO
MKLRFSKKEKIILFAVAILLVTITVFAQFTLLYPLKSDLKLKEQQLVTQKKLLDIINQKKSTSHEAVTTEVTSDIQQKIPVKPMQEQFILDLEKAETISNNQIISMSFTKDAEAATETDTENTSTVESDTTSQDSPEQIAERPAILGLKKLTASLGVKSPSYEELEKFIDTLESLKRIVVVEAISYSGGEEITSLEQEKTEISYNLTISAYYLPELNDLIAEVPKIDAPAPANKKNPLTTFSDTTQSN